MSGNNRVCNTSDVYSNAYKACCMEDIPAMTVLKYKSNQDRMNRYDF
jgi:hypothetical protein